MAHNFPQGSIPGQWVPQGQEQWQYPRITMPMGYLHGLQLKALLFCVPHPIAPPTKFWVQQYQPGGFSFPRVPQQTTSPPISTPMTNSEADITKMEERLSAAMEKRFETMTEALKTSMLEAKDNPHTDTVRRCLEIASNLRDTSSSILTQPNLLGAPTVAPTFSGDHQLAATPMVSPKSKPLTPNETIPVLSTAPRTTTASSKDRSRHRKPKKRNPSRRSRSSRRSTRRQRGSSRRPHRGDHGSARLGSRHPRDSSAHRPTASTRPPRTVFTESRNFSHPIYHRSNAMRRRSSTPTSTRNRIPEL